MKTLKETWIDYRKLVESIISKDGANDPWQEKIQNDHHSYINFFEELITRNLKFSEEDQAFLKDDSVTRDDVDMNKYYSYSDEVRGDNYVLEYFRLMINRATVELTVFDSGEINNKKILRTWLSSTISDLSLTLKSFAKEVYSERAIESVHRYQRGPMMDFSTNEIATNTYLIFDFLLVNLEKVFVWLNGLSEPEGANDAKIISFLDQKESMNIDKALKAVDDSNRQFEDVVEYAALDSINKSELSKPGKNKTEPKITEGEMEEYRRYVSNCVLWLSEQKHKGRNVIREKECEQLKEYLLDFLNNPLNYNGLNKPEKRIKTGWTSYNLSATFHRLHLDIGSSVIPKKFWIYFLHSIFRDFDRRRTSGDVTRWVTFKKFSVPNDNDSNLFENLTFIK